MHHTSGILSFILIYDNTGKQNCTSESTLKMVQIYRLEGFRNPIGKSKTAVCLMLGFKCTKWILRHQFLISYSLPCSNIKTTKTFHSKSKHEYGQRYSRT